MFVCFSLLLDDLLQTLVSLFYGLDEVGELLLVRELGLVEVDEVQAAEVSQGVQGVPGVVLLHHQLEQLHVLRPTKSKLDI